MSAILIRMFAARTIEKLEAKVNLFDTTGLTPISTSGAIETPDMKYFLVEYENN